MPSEPSREVIHVRVGAPADAEALARMFLGLWPDGTLAERREEAKAILSSAPPSTLPLAVFLAEAGGEVAGFLEVGLRSHADGCDERQSVGFVEGWYVEAEHRRSGVGRALMRAAEDWARAQGCRELASDTWIDHEDSQRAHEAVGFEVVDRCVNFKKSLGVAGEPEAPPGRTDRRAFHLPSGAGRQFLFRGTRMHVKVGHAEGAAYSLIEMAHPPNVGPALHRHPGGDEAFYVLEGEYEIRCGDDVFVATAGAFVFVPSGAAHGYTVGPAGGRLLVVTPAGLDRYFAEVADRLEQGPVSMDAEAEIASRYGQDFLDRLRHWGA